MKDNFVAHDITIFNTEIEFYWLEAKIQIIIPKIYPRADNKG